jgi:protease-4
MKFFKIMFATFFGVLLFNFFAFILLLAVVAGLAASGGGDVKKVIADNSILKLELNGAISERGKKDPFAKFNVNFGGEGSQGVLSIRKALKEAKNDPKIKGVYLDAKFLGAYPAQMTEIREALVDFRKSGKWIVSYGEYYTEGVYYLASAASDIYINPGGYVEFNGLNSNIMFLKGALDKLEIKPEVFRVGEFKSAVEPFILDKMSDANRKQVTAYLNSINDSYLGAISKSRNIELGTLRVLSDSMTVRHATDAVTHKLMDKTLYYDEVLDVLAKKTGEKADELNFVSLSDYLSSVDNENDEFEKESNIAVIVASGEIQGAKATGDNIGSDEISEQIRKAKNDSKIKAIVLRVNSPGGSALASDIMWHEIQLARKVKPVIASMSGLAASGGYYISMGCDTIVADPTTITGSIGVFGLMFNTQAMFNNKLGITFDRVNTGTYSDFGDPNRKMSAGERAIMQDGVNKIYEEFTSKAAQGRHTTQDKIKEVAGGRVWTGAQAKEIGLVDVLGNFDDALAIAAKMAKLKEGDYGLVFMPKEKNFFEELAEGFDTKMQMWAMESQLGPDLARAAMEMKKLQTRQGIQARIPYDIDVR